MIAATTTTTSRLSWLEGGVEPISAIAAKRHEYCGCGEKISSLSEAFNFHTCHIYKMILGYTLRTSMLRSRSASHRSVIVVVSASLNESVRRRTADGTAKLLLMS